MTDLVERVAVLLCGRELARRGFRTPASEWSRYVKPHNRADAELVVAMIWQALPNAPAL